MDYLVGTKEEIDLLSDHMDKIKKLPEQESDLKRGKKCFVPAEQMLAKHWAQKRKHPGKNQYAYPCCAEVKKYQGHRDLETDHVISVNTAKALTKEWATEDEIVVPDPEPVPKPRIISNRIR